MKVDYLVRGLYLLPLVLFIGCAACSPLAIEVNSSSAETVEFDEAASQSEFPSLDASTPGQADVSANRSQSDPLAGHPVLALSYIWSISGIEPDKVVMALNQENETLYGQAKYEPDGEGAWNAMVIGSVKGDRVDLVLTYLNDTVETSARLNGTYIAANQSIRGELLKMRDGAIYEQGIFEAIWINPDTTSYTPAIISLKAESLDLSQSTPSIKAAADAAQSSSDDESYFYDVRKSAARILTGVGDLSQIPIGMGGSGLS